MSRSNLASTARNILIPPFIFGNEAQIRALRVLAMLAELAELYDLLPEKTRQCDWCKGERYCKCGECGHVTTCGNCGGSGRVILSFDENEWIDLAHLIKHLVAMRAELADMRGGAAA